MYDVCVATCERPDELVGLWAVIFCVLLAQAVGLTYQNNLLAQGQVFWIFHKLCYLKSDLNRSINGQIY